MAETNIMGETAAPTGIVTFMFTDIEGSTTRWERDPAAMSGALRAHDGIVSAAIGAHGGYVFKTLGDAFCAAFARAGDAVAAALAIQRNLAAHDFGAVGGLCVRAALHSGTADERDGDYFGPVVNRVARLLAIAHGGQVIVSGITAELAQAALPAGATLRDLGAHRLKDLARPERVFGLVASDLPANFPPLRSLDVLAHNLPPQLTPFIGRAAEVADVTALLAQHRLVTLVGSGGIGKTRTSLQVAANLLDGSGDGVWLIELAPLSSAAYLPTAVAQAVRIALPALGDPLELLVEALCSKHLLLVFDNCEHILGGAAQVIAAVLRGCPRVTILASSRQALEISGERAYRLPSLPVSAAPDDRPLTAARARQSAAVELFVDRARAVDERFGLDDTNAATIAEICRRLDGIPLAIELAAARVRVLGPGQLSRRLDERFRILTGGRRDALPRQQTLRALIDWSHDLLDEPERVLFRRLGIFVNGFTLEGALAVGCDAGDDEFALVDVLTSLVDKSLVLAEPAGDAVRYHMLESTRAYAGEKLAAADERSLASERHLRYLSARFAAAFARLQESADPGELEALIATELDDVRAALDFAAIHDVRCGAELLATVENRWGLLGASAEGVRRGEEFLARLAGDEHALRAQLLAIVYASGAVVGMAVRSARLIADCVAAARASGDPEVLAVALKNVCNSATLARRFDEAAAALREAETLAPVSRLRRLTLVYSRGYLAQLQGDLDTAAAAYHVILDHYRRTANIPGQSSYLLNLAEVEHARGRTADAIALVEEALPASRALKERRRLALLLANLSGYALAVDDVDRATAAAHEAIRELALADRESPFMAVALEHLALACALRGEVSRAATLAGYTAAVVREHRLERAFTERGSYDRLVPLLEARLAPDELAARQAAGAALSSDAAVALALERNDGRASAA